MKRQCKVFYLVAITIVFALILVSCNQVRQTSSGSSNVNAGNSSNTTAGNLSNVSAGSPSKPIIEVTEFSDEPDVVQQCETICKAEENCKTLPAEKTSECMKLCRAKALNPAVRKCMAATTDCSEFANCARLQSEKIKTADVPAKPAAKAKVACGSNLTVSCPGCPDCHYPQVCCTQIFGGGGSTTRINVCGTRDCPWYYFGQGPWCGCPDTSDVYDCT